MNHSVQTINIVLYCAFAVPASIIDCRSRRIPDWCTLLGALALFASTAIFSAGTLITSLAAAVLCSGLFIALRIFTRGLGFGDVKFVALTGLLCGFFGSALALMIASVSALVFWGVLALGGKADPSTRIPFAPFIAFGTILSALVTMVLINFTF